MTNSYDTFRTETENERRNRNQLWFLLVICFSNMIILLSYMLGFQWWHDHSTLSTIISIVYTFYCLFSLREPKGTLFSNGLTRFRHWRDFHTTKSIYETAPSKDDYLEIESGEELQFLRLSITHRGNNDPTLELIDITNGDVVYSSKQGSTLKTPLCNLYDELRKNNVEVKAIYNKWGDYKWLKSDTERKPSWKRKLTYNAGLFLWFLSTIVFALIPILVLSPGLLFYMLGSFLNGEPH